jgi:hypothetical protein
LQTARTDGGEYLRPVLLYACIEDYFRACYMSLSCNMYTQARDRTDAVLYRRSFQLF